MSAKPVIVVAVFEARPGKEAELKKLLRGLLAPTRKENGCLGYELHIARDNPAKFLFHETWASQAILDVHSKSPHLTAALPQAAELCAHAPEITLWEKLA
jgi:quinol monooxygenase YgiN